jgi:hypothetical protein
MEEENFLCALRCFRALPEQEQRKVMREIVAKIDNDADRAAFLERMGATMDALKSRDSSTFQLLQDHCVNVRTVRTAMDTPRALGAGFRPSLLDKWDSGGALTLATCVAQGTRLSADEAALLVEDYAAVIGLALCSWFVCPQ